MIISRFLINVSICLKLTPMQGLLIRHHTRLPLYAVPAPEFRFQLPG